VSRSRAGRNARRGAGIIRIRCPLLPRPRLSSGDRPSLSSQPHLRGAPTRPRGGQACHRGAGVRPWYRQLPLLSSVRRPSKHHSRGAARSPRRSRVGRRGVGVRPRRRQLQPPSTVHRPSKPHSRRAATSPRGSRVGRRGAGMRRRCR
jgi:hypothetical protein